MLRPDVVMPPFNRLVDELERVLRQTDSGTATLAAGTTETTVTSRVVTPTSTVIVTPGDAVAAGAQDWYVTPAQGSFLITHGSNGSPRSVVYFVT